MTETNVLRDATLLRPGVAQQAVDPTSVRQIDASLERACDGGDIEDVFAVMAPALLPQFGIGTTWPRTRIAATTETSMAEIETEDFGMDPDTAPTGRTPAGHGDAFVPATVTMQVPGRGALRSVKTTPALTTRAGQHDDACYQMRPDDPDRVAILRATLPDMGDVDVPPSAREARP